MNFLCPSCRTPLPREQSVGLVTCTQCAVQVDLTRVDTAPGQARLWPEVDLKGETLSGHALVQRLGSGGMGTVYEAESPVGAPVAMKVLSPMLAAEPALRERFRREARALTQVKHPRVVQLFEEGEDRGFCWYSMELVKGLDLRHRLEKGVLSAAEVDALAVALLEALAAVHEAGVVHRDIKPSNILLGPEGPRLCDFGIAQVSGATTLTESAALLGSLRYMAPEQRWGRADDRSDLYSLGVVLHEALAGGVPGEQPLPGGTPKYLGRFIERLTHQNPTQRPTSAREAARLLTQLRRGDFKRLALGGAAVAGLVLVGVLVATLSGDPPAPPQPRETAADSNPVPTPPVATVDAGSPEDAGTAVAALTTVDAGALDIDLAATGKASFLVKGVLQVELDGTRRSVPSGPLELPTGKHVVRFVCSGGKAGERVSPPQTFLVDELSPALLTWSCATMKPIPSGPSPKPTKGKPVGKVIPLKPEPKAEVDLPTKTPLSKKKKTK